MCTQLDYLGFSEREKKRILLEWIDFLRANTKALKALYLPSRVPQKLFDAACCQENLETLTCKWGAYKDLSAIKNLKNLKYLYLGSCPSVADITPLCSQSDLVVLHIENFQKTEDYSPLAALQNLEQLIIGGSVWGRIYMTDLKFYGICQICVPSGAMAHTVEKIHT